MEIIGAVFALSLSREIPFKLPLALDRQYYLLASNPGALAVASIEYVPGSLEVDEQFLSGSEVAEVKEAKLFWEILSDVESGSSNHGHVHTRPFPKRKIRRRSHGIQRIQ